MSIRDEEQFITLARNLTASGHYARAFDEYILIFKSFPRIKRRLEDEFRVCLMRTNQQLAQSKKSVEIYRNFDIAMNALPRSVALVDDIGRYLRRQGCYATALAYAERAHRIDTRSAIIERHLNDARQQLLPAAQFRNLNDRLKNETYKKAIKSVVRPGKDVTVVLNGGLGLYILFVAETPPTQGVLIERSAPLVQLATQLIKHNRLNPANGTRYQEAILKDTTLLITDDFDSGLFGRGLLDSVSNAWEILKHNKGRIIPGRAEFYIIGAQCDSLHKKYNLGSAAKDLLDVPEWIVNSVQLFGNTYASENVKDYKDIRYLTEPELLLKVDFNSYDEVKSLVNRYKPIYRYLTATKTGTVNCLIGYFKLYLTEDCVITTDPRSDNKCSAWQQAVFFSELATDVIPRQSCQFGFLTNRGVLSIISGYGGQVQISPDMLRFLNDADYMKKISDSIAAAFIYLGQIADLCDLEILDLCPFPLFGFLMMKRGAKSLTARAATYSDREFIETAFELHNIPLSKLTFVSECCTSDTFKPNQFHAIYEHPFQHSGDVNFQLNVMTDYWMHVNLHEDGLVLPSTITLMGQLVECPSLDQDNVLDDSNICGYKMAEHVNRYSLNIRKGLSMLNLDYTPLSGPFVLASHVRNLSSGEVETAVTIDGLAHSLLSYYKIQVIGDLETSTNKEGSFMDNMAYSNKNPALVCKGDRVSFLRCVDKDTTFKISFNV